MKKEVQENTPIEQDLPKNNSDITPSNEVLTSNVETLTTGTETVATASTTGAKGFGALLAKLGTGKIIAIIAAVVIVIGGVVAKIVTSTPKAIFKSTINNISKELDNTIDDLEEMQKKFDTQNKALYFTGDVRFDTNIEGVKDEIDISKYKLGMDIGINPKGSELLIGASVNGDSSIDGKIYIDSENIYFDSTVLDNPINLTEILKEEGIEVDGISEIFDSMNKNNENIQDYTFIIKTLKNALIKTLDSSKMEKSSAKMEVDGKKVSATKVTYKINDKVMRETVKTVCDELKDNDEFISKLADLSGADKSDIKDGIKELKESASDIEFDSTININIYVSGVLNDVVGYDIEIDNDVFISYYTGNKKAELIVYSNPDHAYINVLTEEKKKESITTIRVEDEKIAEITSREIKDGIDLDFSINVDKFDSSVDYSTIKGTVKATWEENKDNIKGDYEFKISIDDKYISASGSYSMTSSDKLDVVKTQDAVSLEDVDFEKIIDNIEDKLGNDELGEVLKDYINQVEEDTMDLNYYGMKEVSESEALDVLKKEKASVLYVGDTYYSYSFEENEYNLFNNLQDAQEDYDFYSYFLDEYDVTSKFTEATKNAPYSCKIETTTTPEESETNPSEENTNEDVEEDINFDDEDEDELSCNEYPVIYFIKDGKIVKALRSDATEDDILDALEEIGKK